MSKLVFSLNLILFSILSFSYGKKKLYKQLKDCEIYYDASEVIAGNTIDLILLSIYKDGTITSSLDSSRYKINFSDLNIKISGPLKIEKKTRKKISLSIDYDAI